MAKVNVICQACQATIILETNKNRRAANSYSRHLESIGFQCNDCESKQIAKENADCGLPPLKGSEKQIAWAESIRKKLLPAIQRDIDIYIDDSEDDENIDLYKSELPKAIASIRAQNEASWWIDNNDIRRLMMHNIAPVIEGIKRGDHTVEASAAKLEAITRPAQQITTSVAEIANVGNLITITLPEKIEQFRLLMHELQYKWSGENWQRQMTVTTGSVGDRMAEAVNRILTIGVPVRVYNNAIRECGISANYIPEHKRWITKLIGGKYAGWISIQWGREDDLYDIVKSLPGSRYHKPNIVVSADHYDALLDLADAHDFRISSGAHEALEAAKSAHYRAAVATPATAAKPEYRDTGSMPPATGEVSDDLRDD